MCNTIEFPICLYTNHLATSNPFQFEDNKIYTFFLNSSLLLSERILVQVSASQNHSVRNWQKSNQEVELLLLVNIWIFRHNQFYLGSKLYQVVFKKKFQKSDIDPLKWKTKYSGKKLRHQVFDRNFLKRSMKNY